ncbi:MAG: 30S ribosomal protein S8 [Ignavibacteria bacterium]|nr:30S ribosomal protein S8 [Ignavibacteria bacterium]
MHSDPIADYLTRVRNALRAGRKVVDIPSSNVKRSISDVLMKQKFIDSYEVINDTSKKTIRIKLKYFEGQSVISGLRRISKPGLRIYSSSDELPRVMNGLGISIVSTSKGVLSDKDARAIGVGGEVLCYIW